ncbi:MAG: ABC transporter substrate-binding protein [Planctomycetota bacterium]
MSRLVVRAAFAVVCSAALWTCGCSTSSTPPGKSGTTTGEKGTTDSSKTGPETSSTTQSGQDVNAAGKETVAARPGYWEDYKDVPKYEIMTEVNGIKIPRLKSAAQSLNLTGKIPADVGNKHATDKASEPTSGDTLTVRFPSEPKVLNPITESSAVQTYIGVYFHEGLARQNPETFEYEPHMASKWVIEDSVKLSADYPGLERRVAREGATPATSLEIEYTLPVVEEGKTAAAAPVVTVTTSDKSGSPLDGVWVGVYPIGKIEGAATMGYHFWSEKGGKVQISSLPSGRYTVKVGSEVYGKAQRQADGSVIVTPATTENPLNATLKGEPSLTLKAEDFTDVHEQTYYTYYLRDDVTWSDGTPFTTKDIEFGYTLLNSPSVDGDHIRTYYADLIECKALSPLVVRMRYRQQYFKAFEFTYGITLFTPPFHYFEKIFKEQGRELTLTPLTPDAEQAEKKISAHGAEFGKFFNTDSRYNRSPMGTGQYIVDKWESKDRVELVRNPNYWNKKLAGHVDKIIVKFIPDQVTAMKALKAGEIDFFYDMSPEQYFEDWKQYDSPRKDDFVLASWYSPMFSYFGWNFLAPQFQDRRVRIALAMLMDRQDFVDTKLHGAGVVVSGTQYYFGPGYDREVAPIGYDPETARELLSDAGWIDTDNDGILDKDGKKFEVVLRLAQGRAINVARCEVLQKNLKSVGIDLQIQQLEWASFIEKVRAKECDVITLSWATPVESDPFQIWHSSQAGRSKRGSNTISYANPQADSLIEMLRVTLDENKRKRIHQSFHRLIDSEQPYMFLWIPKEFGVYHKRFRNVKWYRLRPGFDLSEWYVPKDEQLH